jgi:hypothetical protein
MRKIPPLVVAAAVAAAAACGGSSSGDPDGAVIDGPVIDAGFDDWPDAIMADAEPPFNPALCPETYGPASVIATFRIASSAAEAFDLNGDGTPDNRLGSVAGVANPGLQDSLDSGEFRLVSELRRLSDPTLVNDDSLDLVAYPGVDLDDPVDPTDDFSGFEPFYFDPVSVTWDCEPRSMIPSKIEDGTLSGSSDEFTVAISGFGTVDVQLARLVADIAPAETPAKGFELTGARLGGVIPACVLYKAPAAQGSNMLEVLVQFNVMPDIDVDGDGLETFFFDAGGMLRCVDGDGTTSTLPDCACHPRIKDGYSVLFELTTVGAELVGPAP